VARLRFKEMTIRLLREQLHAADAGRIGRHSGRTLADTYAVGAVVGTGGMGEVYAGEHRRTRRRVAIKLLHPHLVEDPQILARFRREAEAIGRLGSEHIVEIVDVGEDDGQPFLVLEYLDGESLAARLAAGPLDLATVDEVIRQLAMGLDAAHRAGVVHRDLKPANVFLCRRDDGSLLVKILDFGVSKVRDNATAITREIAILGTPDYMSPEQAVGLADAVDERSDVFSLGGILYAAVTGRAPFEASSVPAQLRRICDEEPVPVDELRPDAPPGVAAVIAIALAKRPEDRYPRPGELAADLDLAIGGGDVAGIIARAARVQRGRPASRTAGDGLRRDDSVALARTHGG
jgi:serine/threonine-protein kinase